MHQPSNDFKSTVTMPGTVSTAPDGLSGERAEAEPDRPASTKRTAPQIMACFIIDHYRQGWRGYLDFHGEGVAPTVSIITTAANSPV